MFIALDRKRLEAALINMSRPSAVAMRMPPLRVRETEPAHKPRQFAIFVRLQDQVPVIRHQSKGEDFRPGSFHSRDQNPFKRLEIGVIIKDPHPAVRTVQDMVDQTTIRSSFRSTHLLFLTNFSRPVNAMVPDTFYSPAESCGFCK